MPLEQNVFYWGDTARTPTGLDISQNGSGALEEGTTCFIRTTPRTSSQIVPNESVNKGMGCVGWCNAHPRNVFSDRTFKQHIAPGGSSLQSPLNASQLLILLHKLSTSCFLCSYPLLPLCYCVWGKVYISVFTGCFPAGPCRNHCFFLVASQ